MRKISALLWILTAVLLTAGFITGCGSSNDDGGGTNSGNVKGTVTDNSGNPMPGAACAVTTTDTKEVFTDTTDEEGLFLISGITPGTWPLSISKSGYQTLSLTVTISSGSTTEVPADETIISPTTGTGTVTGVVSDSCGGNVEGAAVSIGTTETTSDTEGSYTLTGVPAGSQTITAAKSGYENYSGTVEVIANSSVSFHFAMISTAPQPGKGHVRGKVIDENGNAISDVSVTSGTITDTTDSNGEYSLLNLEPGTATLSFVKTGLDNAAVSVTVIADQSITADTVTMTAGMATGITILCSVSRTTENGAKGANYSSCSDDGAYVSFLADQKLLAIHISGAVHTYLFSRSSGTLTMIDKSPQGLEGSLNGAVADSVDSHINGDGTFIAFSTSADNLIEDQRDDNSARDVFVYEIGTGNISRVSVDYSNPLVGGYADDAKTAGAASRDGHLSKDGSYLVFRSRAKNLVSPGLITDVAATHTTWNIYRVKLTAGNKGVTVSSPMLISGRQSDGKECDPADWGNSARTSEIPWMSSDGRFIVYATNALAGANFTGGAGDSLLNAANGYRDAGADRDIVICDTEKTVQTMTTFVSENETGIRQFTGGNICETASVSDDGTKVVFECNDALGRWISGNDGNSDVWLKNLSTGSLIRVSDTASGTRGVSAPGMVSRDGTMVAFSSFGTGFVQNDNNGNRDCFIYNIEDYTFTRVSLNSENIQADDNSFRPYLSGNNQYVSFTSPAKNLAINPYLRTGSFDVYLRKWQ